MSQTEQQVRELFAQGSAILNAEERRVVMALDKARCYFPDASIKTASRPFTCENYRCRRSVQKFDRYILAGAREKYCLHCAGDFR